MPATALVACAILAAGSVVDWEARARALELEVAALRRQVAPRERAAEPVCSGNGFSYPDVGECTCFTCFSGANCETEVENCLLYDKEGNPTLFEEYWREVSLDMVEPSWYRTPYDYTTADKAHEPAPQGSILPALRQTLSLLHMKAGNIADPAGKDLVIATGGTELLGAVTYACKMKFGPKRPMHMYAQPPYYNGYPASFVGLGIENLTFSSSPSLDPSSVVEFVAYPNNPDMHYNEPTYGSRSACVVHDQVYFWPSLTNLTEGHAPTNNPISLFSLSKVTGHAGTRFGWAFVDPALGITDYMVQYIKSLHKHVSIDSQYRALSMVQYLAGPDDLRFFSWVRGKLTARWQRMLDVFPAGGARFKQHARINGFYAWVECLKPQEATNCTSVFVGAGISPQPGVIFGGTPAFVRLELVVADSVWNLLSQRLGQL
ncbi:Tryptophan aminotransferase-related protein 3 [Diplonema papillatum]|nr:Tryptophan aminotransferase-related protein 3 [Diplonema papillatum]|eukprot:gene19541-30104_t